MRKFWAFIKIFYLERLEYRSDMVVYSIGTILTPIIGLALWLTAANFNILPYDKYQVIAYFIAVIYIGTITEMWQSWPISEDINEGRFSYVLIRPISIITRYASENISDKIFKIIVITISVPILFFLIPGEVWSQFVFTPLSIILFLYSLIIGYMLIFFIELSIGLSAVWLNDIDFLKNALSLVGDLLAGRFIPLAFLSGVLLSIASILPFRYIVSFPIELLLNNLTTDQIIFGLIAESIWFLMSILIYKLIFLAFEKSYRGYGA